jgi:hypothetical protein
MVQQQVAANDSWRLVLLQSAAVPLASCCVAFCSVHFPLQTVLLYGMCFMVVSLPHVLHTFDFVAELCLTCHQADRHCAMLCVRTMPNCVSALRHVMCTHYATLCVRSTSRMYACGKSQGLKLLMLLCQCTWQGYSCVGCCAVLYNICM